jgi:hypothetical protein
MVQVVRTFVNWTAAVPITVGYAPYKFFTEYGMAMPERLPGQVILIGASAEVTNNYGYNCQLDAYLGYGLPDANQDETKTLTPNSGGNITPGEHHHPIHIVGVIDDALLTRWGLPLTLPYNWVLTLMLQAASTAALPGDYLTNEAGTGELWAVYL